MLLMAGIGTDMNQLKAGDLVRVKGLDWKKSHVSWTGEGVVFCYNITVLVGTGRFLLCGAKPGSSQNFATIEAAKAAAEADYFSRLEGIGERVEG